MLSGRLASSPPADRVQLGAPRPAECNSARPDPKAEPFGFPVCTVGEVVACLGSSKFAEFFQVVDGDFEHGDLEGGLVVDLVEQEGAGGN